MYYKSFLEKPLNTVIAFAENYYIARTFSRWMNQYCFSPIIFSSLEMSTIFWKLKKKQNKFVGKCYILFSDCWETLIAPYWILERNLWVITEYVISLSLSIIYTVVFRLCIRSFIHSYGTTRHGVICREKEKRKPERRKKRRTPAATHTHIIRLMIFSHGHDLVSSTRFSSSVCLL
jgi:hypothetical protein